MLLYRYVKALEKRIGPLTTGASLAQFGELNTQDKAGLLFYWNLKRDDLLEKEKGKNVDLPELMQQFLNKCLPKDSEERAHITTLWRGKNAYQWAQFGCFTHGA